MGETAPHSFAMLAIAQPGPTGGWTETPLERTLSWSTSSLGFGGKVGRRMLGVTGHQPDSQVGIASVDHPHPRIPPAVPPTHWTGLGWAGLGGVRFAPAVYSTVMSCDSVIAALLLAGRVLLYAGWAGLLAPRGKGCHLFSYASKESFLPPSSPLL